MEYKLTKTIYGFWESRRYTDKYIFYVDTKYNARCLNKDTLECIWTYENVYNGFINNEIIVVELKSSKVLLYSLIEKRIMQIMDGKLNSSVGKFGLNYYYGNTDEGLITQYDLNTNQILKKQPSKYPVVLLIDDFTYLTLIHSENNKWEHHAIAKINFCNDSVFWKFKISDLGPCMYWDYLNPPVWEKRRCYNMYYIDGIVYVSVSKGVVALDAETGKQLWWVDFNTTETSTLFYDIDPYYLSFADGKIYIRDWGQFVSIDMKTGEILMRKKYIGFKIGDEVVDNTMTSGIKIHNGKGYFVLDVQAELYLTSLDLETGEVRIEAELPDVKDQVSAENIHFEGNRMYLRDNASFLYVYEVTE